LETLHCCCWGWSLSRLVRYSRAVWICLGKENAFT